MLQTFGNSMNNLAFPKFHADKDIHCSLSLSNNRLPRHINLTIICIMLFSLVHLRPSPPSPSCLEKADREMYSSWLSRTKSRDYNARLPPCERNRRCCISFLLLILLFLLLLVSFRIPPPPVIPPFSALPSFYFESRDPLSHRRLSHSTQAVFIYGIETPLFCIFIILPQLEAGFCAYYVATYSFSFAERYLSSRRIKSNKRKE